MKKLAKTSQALFVSLVMVVASAGAGWAQPGPTFGGGPGMMRDGPGMMRGDPQEPTMQQDLPKCADPVVASGLDLIRGRTPSHDATSVAQDVPREKAATKMPHGISFRL